MAVDNIPKTIEWLERKESSCERDLEKYEIKSLEKNDSSNFPISFITIVIDITQLICL